MWIGGRARPSSTSSKTWRFIKVKSKLSFAFYPVVSTLLRLVTIKSVGLWIFWYPRIKFCSYLLLTEVGAYPQLSRQPKFFYHFQTHTAIYYGHSELSCEEKSKFKFEGKKFSLLLKREVCRRFCLENATFSNKLNFFSSNSNFDFSSRDNSEWP